MNTIAYKQGYVQGWRLFCAGSYLNDCISKAQRDGFCAAWREAESGSVMASGPPVWIKINGFELALFPNEDINEIIAEVEAILSEKDTKPHLGVEMDVNWNSGVEL